MPTSVPSRASCPSPTRSRERRVRRSMRCERWASRSCLRLGKGQEEAHHRDTMTLLLELLDQSLLPIRAHASLYRRSRHCAFGCTGWHEPEWEEGSGREAPEARSSCSSHSGSCQPVHPNAQCRLRRRSRGPSAPGHRSQAGACIVSLADQIKGEARQAIDALRAMGIEVLLATGGLEVPYIWERAKRRLTIATR
jgi:hypothetical protein